MEIHSAIDGERGARCYNDDRYEFGSVLGSSHLGNLGSNHAHDFEVPVLWVRAAS